MDTTTATVVGSDHCGRCRQLHTATVPYDRSARKLRMARHCGVFLRVGVLGLLLQSVACMKLDGQVDISSAAPAFIAYVAVAAGSGETVARVSFDIVVQGNASSQLFVVSEATWRSLPSTCNCSCAASAALPDAWAVLTPNARTTDRMLVPGAADPEFVFIAAVSCGLPSDPSITLDWSLHILFEHTGFSEIDYSGLGLLPSYAAATFVSACVLVAFVAGHSWIYTDHWHGTATPVKAGAAAGVFWCLACALLLLHWAVVAATGKTDLGVEGTGRVFDAISRLILVGMLLAVARGLGVTHAKPSRGTRIYLVTVVTLIGVTYVALAAWYVRGRTVASTTYVYDSPQGLTVVGLQGAVGILFVVDVIQRLREPAIATSPPKRRFYQAALSIFTLYFVAQPVIVGIGMLLPDWQDERVVEITSLSFTAAVFVALVILLRPSVSDVVFDSWSRDKWALLRALHRSAEGDRSPLLLPRAAASRLAPPSPLVRRLSLHNMTFADAEVLELPPHSGIGADMLRASAAAGARNARAIDSPVGSASPGFASRGAPRSAGRAAVITLEDYVEALHSMKSPALKGET